MAKAIRRFILKADDIAAYAASAFIVANMAVVVYNVLMRLLFKSPVTGLTDIVGFISAVNAALALGFTEKGRGFIRVDFVAEYFPLIVQKVLHIIMSLISTAIIGLASARMFMYVLTTYRAGTVTSIMFLPYWPVAVVIFVGLVIFFLTTIVNAVDVVTGWKGETKQ